MSESDLTQFLKMLDSCGHKYSVEYNTDQAFWVGDRMNKEKRILTVNMVTVQGCFYDELYCYFDEQENLLEMQSHVAFSDPTTPALKRKLRIT